jgi:hypothetical protein
MDVKTMLKMFRVDLPDYPYALFFVEDPRNDERFIHSCEEIEWEVIPVADQAEGLSVPAFKSNGSWMTEIYDGIIGRSQSDPKHYCQTNDRNNLLGYEIIEMPTILPNWDAWVTTLPKPTMDLDD